MRTTLAIDDDLLAAARHEASRQRKTIGAVVSERLRQTYVASAGKITVSRFGIPLLPEPPGGGSPVTTKEVIRLLNESE